MIFKSCKSRKKSISCYKHVILNYPLLSTVARILLETGVCCVWGSSACFACSTCLCTSPARVPACRLDPRLGPGPGSSCSQAWVSRAGASTQPEWEPRVSAGSRSTSLQVNNKQNFNNGRQLCSVHGKLVLVVLFWAPNVGLAGCGQHQ